MLKKVFGPSDCAKCRLCCNFQRESAWETPFLTDEQAARFEADGVEIVRRERGGASFALRFVDGCDDPANCPFLDPARGCSLSDDLKPFECKVWPLRTMEKDGRLVVGRYRNCPALAGEKGAALDRLATEELLPTLLAFVAENPASIRPFSPLYDVCWEGDLPASFRATTSENNERSDGNG